MSKEQELKEMLKLYSKQDLWNRIQEKQAMIYDLEAKLAEKQKENATLESMLAENANDRKTMQEFKIGEDEYDLTDEDARNSLCWEVKELKQQLAESENQCRECKHLNKKIELNIKNKLMAENCELQKQLAEKEKQLENAQNLKAIEVADELSLKLSKIHNQDKISFTVEQLEKMKENIHYLLSFDYNLLCKVNEQFDNQINVLRNNKDGIH